MDNEIVFYFNEQEDKVYREKLVKDISGDVVDIQPEVIMDKETFIKCFNEWIKG